MALGMTAVIITGGIDLSVGSVMGVVGIVVGLFMHAKFAWWWAVAGGLGTGLICGLFNGILITRIGLSPFVITLGTLSIARSVAVLLSQNKMIYDFGPYADQFFGILRRPVHRRQLCLAADRSCRCAFAFVLTATQWGRHLTRSAATSRRRSSPACRWCG